MSADHVPDIVDEVMAEPSQSKPGYASDDIRSQLGLDDDQVESVPGAGDTVGVPVVLSPVEGPHVHGSACPACVCLARSRLNKLFRVRRAVYSRCHVETEPLAEQWVQCDWLIAARAQKDGLMRLILELRTALRQAAGARCVFPEGGDLMQALVGAAPVFPTLEYTPYPTPIHVDLIPLPDELELPTIPELPAVAGGVPPVRSGHAQSVSGVAVTNCASRGQPVLPALRSGSDLLHAGSAGMLSSAPHPPPAAVPAAAHVTRKQPQKSGARVLASGGGAGPFLATPLGFSHMPDGSGCADADVCGAGVYQGASPLGKRARREGGQPAATMGGQAPPLFAAPPQAATLPWGRQIYDYLRGHKDDNPYTQRPDLVLPVRDFGPDGVQYQDTRGTPGQIPFPHNPHCHLFRTILPGVDYQPASQGRPYRGDAQHGTPDWYLLHQADHVPAPVEVDLWTADVLCFLSRMCIGVNNDQSQAWELRERFHLNLRHLARDVCSIRDLGGFPLLSPSERLYYNSLTWNQKGFLKKEAEAYHHHLYRCEDWRIQLAHRQVRGVQLYVDLWAS